MSCTTILAGKNATCDGSTFAARNEDSGSGSFMPKKFIVVSPSEQPGKYRSVLSHVEIELPEHPMRYTAMPNATEKEGIWAAAGVNEVNVSMTATETITSNERVLGADPLVRYLPEKDGQDEQAGGIGEEDIVSITLPYIRSAREGVERLGMLLEKYGTYEMNGIAFQDMEEVWWLETIGGHHWIAKRVPDDAYVIMPNQLGIDSFDLADALGEKKAHMCSADLPRFIEENHLSLSFDGTLNPREAFGSHSDADHIYNTPRAWFIARYLNPHSFRWDGENADFRPESDDIPWSFVPERKLTVEDVKYVLSAHFQGTPYDPYAKYGDPAKRGCFRPIGINRNNFLSLVQLRPSLLPELCAIEWVAFGSNVFNAFVPFYANVNRTPDYMANTGERVTTENFYWANRLLGALADAQFSLCKSHIERYQAAVPIEGYRILHEYDERIGAGDVRGGDAVKLLEEANERIAVMVQEKTDDTLDKVLYEASCQMKNGFSRSDA